MNLIRPIFILATACVGRSIADDDNNTNTTTKLSNGIVFPTIGMGIGNLQHDLIEEVVQSGLRLGFRLIDTAHASENEDLLASAIVESDNYAVAKSESLPPIHIVSKVWYTHLGYERTKISVQETLNELKAITTRQVYVHMLLHWPSCNDNIEWMNCEEEEERLPEKIKNAGPPPHLNKSTSWKESWKALEIIYKAYESQRKANGNKVQGPIIASIGVSNFDIDEMKSLMEVAKVKPHIYQGDIWSAFHDPDLVRYLNHNKIYFQAYGVMDRTLRMRDESKSAFSILSDISREIASTMHAVDENKGKTLLVTEATVLLAYFVQRGIGVIPRASYKGHRQENSPSVIDAVIPYLDMDHFNRLQLAVPALMKGRDVHSVVYIENSLSGPIQLHWVNDETGEEVLVKDGLEPGKVEVIQSHPGHKFVAYDAERSVRREIAVDVGYGQRKNFAVEL